MATTPGTKMVKSKVLERTQAICEVRDIDSLRFFWVAETFGEKNFDAAGGDVNASADVFGERNQEFARGCIYGKERRTGLRFSGKEDIANLAEKCRCFQKRTR